MAGGTYRGHVLTHVDVPRHLMHARRRLADSRVRDEPQADVGHVLRLDDRKAYVGAGRATHGPRQGHLNPGEKEK